MAGTKKQIAQFLSEHIVGMKLVKANGATDASLQSVGELLKKLEQCARADGAHTLLFFEPLPAVLAPLCHRAFCSDVPVAELSRIITFAATLYLIQKIFTYAESGQSSASRRQHFGGVHSMMQFKEELRGVQETDVGSTGAVQLRA